MATDDKRFNPGSSANDSAPPPPAAPPISTTLPPLQTEYGAYKGPGQARLGEDLQGENQLHGHARYMHEFDQARQGATWYYDDPRFDNWAMSLKPDPTDLEYNNLVAQAQAEARANFKKRAAQESLKAQNQRGKPGNNVAQISPATVAGAQDRPATGSARVARIVAQAPGPADSDAHDDYILSLKEDPFDPEYNYYLNQYKVKAYEDKRRRAGDSAINERALDIKAKKDAQAYRAVDPTQFVDENGNIIDPDKASLGSSIKPGGQASTIADDGTSDYEQLTDDDYIKGGGAVWVGDVDIDGYHKAGQYRNALDMMNDVHSWSPAQTAAFQQRYGLDVTGIPDDDTVKLWQWAVNSARLATSRGNHRTVDSFLMGAREANLKARHGGGGGGGGGAAIPADAAKRLLNSVMKQFAGREATADELKAFLPAIRGAAGGADFDGQQFAEDWVRGGDTARNSEVASYQAATDYYAVLQQLLGGG